MAAEPQQLHVVLFPFMAQGHLIPTLDIARLFAARNVKATIVTTPINAANFTRAIGKGTDPNINIQVFRYPGKELVPPFQEDVELLQAQLEQYLNKERPNCLVADVFFPWASESAAKFNIPRLIFHGTSYFSLSAIEVVRTYKPYKIVSTDDEPFILPLVPHEVKLMKSQISECDVSDENASIRIRTLIKESELNSFGVLVNSFYELEPEYADFYTRQVGRKTWHIGPVSLCNKSVEEKGHRGQQASIDGHECMEWLNTKKQSSVIYICFGSAASSIAPQFYEIAMALERSGQNFIWVMKKDENDNNEEWLPQGFEQRMEGKGIIIRGWAPQVLILEHEATGAFVTHCGWNSTLEAISAGVPMVTWPVFAEQFYNELLVTQILKIGVPVGAKKCNKVPLIEDVINQNAIEKALREIMVGGRAEEIRNRAKRLKDMARKAVEEGGSSYSDLTALIEELRGSS